MNTDQSELRATELLLQRGVRVKARAPLFLRLFGKKTVTLKLSDPTGGALMRMGRWYLMCQLSADQLEEISTEDALLFNARYGDYIYRALACLFIGNKLLTKLFLKPYSVWLRESLTVKDAFKLLQLVIVHGGLSDFMTTTRYIRSQMITVPRLGQRTKRS